MGVPPVGGWRFEVALPVMAWHPGMCNVEGSYTGWQTGKLTIGMESGSFGRYISIYPIEDEDKLHGNPMLVFPEGSVYICINGLQVGCDLNVVSL